jgi:hypothetical protein
LLWYSLEIAFQRTLKDPFLVKIAPIPSVPSQLDLLRQEMARPHKGKPARYEISFRANHMCASRSLDAFNYWWSREAVPVMKNMTGDRARFESGSCYVAEREEAVLIAMFFQGFVIGVLDWDNTVWVTLPKIAGSVLPDW